MTDRPSPRAAAALLHIRGQLLVRGCPPSQRELATLMGVSLTRANQYVVQLERCGLLTRAPGKSRALSLAPLDAPPVANLQTATP